MLLSQRSKQSPAGDAQGFFSGGKYTYEKTLGVDSKNAYLSFDGVYKNTRVYLNEEEKAFVPYGYIPFVVELGNVKKDDEVKVECDNLDQPDSRWYAGAGIYRDVYLYTAEKDYILPNGVKVETLDYQKGLIHVTVKTSNGEANVEVLDDGKVVASGKGNDLELTVDNPKLWNVDSPNLYTLKVTLGDDVVEERFGIRQVERRKDGVISMARAKDPNSASCQFFIMIASSPHLDGNYAAFGKVISGLEHIHKMAKDAKPIDDNGIILPDQQPVINSIKIKK